MEKGIARIVCLVLISGVAALAQNQNNGGVKTMLSNHLTEATQERPFVNSLGMKFVPVTGTKTLISVWDTRVQDFQEFVKDTGYKPIGGMMVLNVKKNADGSCSMVYEMDKEASWQNPGFKQGADYPVVGVSWTEAKAFCAWLTEKERKAGIIRPRQTYQLPTSAEWDSAVGNYKYPWGNSYPPPPEAGNYLDDAFVSKMPTWTGWANLQLPENDGYGRTSSVGAFKPNQLGLYDIGGNVWQWLEDWYQADMNESGILEKFPSMKNDGGGHRYHMAVGAAWCNGSTPNELLQSSFRLCDNTAAPVHRYDDCGFRCVLETRPTSVRTATLNVQILGRGNDAKGNSNPKPRLYSGAGIIGTEGDFWNGVKADSAGQPLIFFPPGKMVASDGKTLTNVKLRFSGFVNSYNWTAEEGAVTDNALMDAYAVGGSGATVAIQGLVPSSFYDLYLFGNNARGGAGAKFIANSGESKVTQGQKGTMFTKGTDYVEFKDVLADKDGTIKVTLDPANPAVFAADILNGFQLRGELPAPSVETAKADSSSWGVAVWLKADDLKRAGLKPGDRVTQWKDNFRGIRFCPDPKTPHNDKAPTYEEIKVAGDSNPVPVVKFDGHSSLRQLDELDITDDQMTVYVVYRNSSSGPWKKLIAKRNGACCTYDGGIATPLNPRLVYAAYEENGIRLGSIDTLPLSITGHQGDSNNRDQFKGYIAEVIAFPKIFGPNDEQRAQIESYLQEKYFDDYEKGRVAPEAPWAGAKPADIVTPTQAEGKLAVRASLPSDIDDGVALNQVNIFSLLTQENPTNTEYAAGDVPVPFSYKATISSAPRPICLNFQDWPNPDCCHCFVRIDGELWMFRCEWIVDNGRPARYRGPDVDHMTRVEDGTYPPEVGLGWFLGGMWYNEKERKLYAPMHVEMDGSDRYRPAVGWFSRKIALATSTDKGKTWKYEGDIITPETYFYNHDVYKFSGTDHCNGLGDFGFYVDTRGGYAYIFPLEGWYPKGQWGALWAPRVARCALKNKLAPGKWEFFYNGKWEESALGGKSTIVQGCHMWCIMYSTYLNKYVCIATENKDPWWGDYSYNVNGVMIGTCSDLSKQDWKWGYCPEAMFGFQKAFNAEGTDVLTCGQKFRLYAYMDGNSFQRLDFTLEKNPMTLNNWTPRFGFEPHPESSDPILSRKTKIVGSASPELKYSGTWIDKSDETSYEGEFKESTTPSSSVEFSFTGADIYWRAVRSPDSGKADVYLDGKFRKTVDCYSPRSTSCEVFVYLKTGLNPKKSHTIQIVVKGEKNRRSNGTAIRHIAFEYSAESYKASAGFCSLMGKNNWYYQQRKDSKDSDMQFIPSDHIFVKDWFGGGKSRIGNNYQIPDVGVESVRKWIAPHGGEVRVEGKVSFDTNANDGVFVQVQENNEELWHSKLLSKGYSAMHDLTVKVEQGDAISFVAGMKAASGTNATKVMWDPVITYIKSQPAVWKPNPPSGKNLALNKYARSKMLVYTYQPYNAVDGNPDTAFTIYGDDKISSGDDWLEVDLDRKYVIDDYAVVSKPANPSWRPAVFTLQKSDDGFAWTDVDTVSNNEKQRCERKVPPFSARYVRIYLPKGKPLSINEFELYRLSPDKS